MTGLPIRIDGIQVETPLQLALGPEGQTVGRWFKDDAGRTRLFSAGFIGGGDVAGEAAFYLDGVKVKLVPVE